MAGLQLSHIYKVYPNGAKAVSDFNIDIEDCEFIVFVGPSGCGKSTTLRMIAGLEAITAGDLYIGDVLVNDIQPKDRDIAMVFQNYALYPHMTVYENMAFALRNKHMSKVEINERVMEAARILDIEDYLSRKPRAMSGGQRQRVALGRAIVRQPKVFLLDEPLSNLDAKLRAQMRTEITKLHQKLKTTFIYVTHDQVEAMTMGTRIVVMKAGFVQQIAPPTVLYDHPVNKFVAGFIGTPQMNFFDVTIERDAKKKEVVVKFEDRQTYSFDEKYFIHADRKYLDGETHCTLGIRPDYLKIAKTGIDLTITSIEALGNETLLYTALGVKNVEAVSNEETLEEVRYVIRIAPTDQYKIGDHIKAQMLGEKVQLFQNAEDDKDATTIMPYVPSSSRIKIKFEKGKYTICGKTYPVLGIWKDVPDGEYDIIIPHDAIVPGDQYSLPVVEVLELPKGKYLITLYDEKNDYYLFSIADNNFPIGSLYSFGFTYGELTLEESSGAKPVILDYKAIGHFHHHKEGKEIVWHLEIGGAHLLMKNELIAKLANIEGRKLLKNDYEIHFKPVLLTSEDQALPEGVIPSIDNKGIAHEVIKKIDAGQKQYLEVKITDVISDLDVTDLKAQDDYVIHVSEEGLEIHSTDTKIRLA